MSPVRLTQQPTEGKSETQATHRNGTGLSSPFILLDFNPAASILFTASSSLAACCSRFCTVVLLLAIFDYMHSITLGGSR